MFFFALFTYSPHNCHRRRSAPRVLTFSFNPPSWFTYAVRNKQRMSNVTDIISLRIPHNFDRRTRVCYSLQRSDPLWGPLFLLFSEYPVCFPVVKPPGQESHHSPLLTFQVNKERSCTPASPVLLYGVDENNFHTKFLLIPLIYGHSTQNVRNFKRSQINLNCENFTAMCWWLLLI